MNFYDKTRAIVFNYKDLHNVLTAALEYQPSYTQQLEKQFVVQSCTVSGQYRRTQHSFCQQILIVTSKKIKKKKKEKPVV